MAFAIASGLKPEAGIFTAIVAGFLISALGGSSAQIGGPAGAFIVIIYGIVERYGVANLLLATMFSGIILVAMGLFRLGNLVRLVPVSIVIGFTNGIAVLIALSQVKEFFGLKIDSMPADSRRRTHPSGRNDTCGGVTGDHLDRGAVRTTHSPRRFGCNPHVCRFQHGRVARVRPAQTVLQSLSSDLINHLCAHCHGRSDRGSRGGFGLGVSIFHWPSVEPDPH